MAEKKFTAIELKKINRNRIYKLIYESQEIARQEIATELSLSLPTVNQNLKELLEMGLIEYEGSFQSTGGRKPQSIVPVKDARVAIGIDIRKSYLRIVAIDMLGNVLDYEKYLKVFSTTDEYGQYLAYLVNNIVEHNHFDQEKVLGVGITMPGILDANMEYVVKVPSFESDKVSVKNLVKFIEYPYVVDNDANAGAFTEFWKELPREDKIYLSVEKGVGGSIICKDGIRKGANLRAGEFGHMTVVPNGRHCYCGQKGCLESYISTARLSDDFGCQIEDFFSGLASGNQEYQKVWEEYIEYLCLGINNINMMYDSDVVLGGVLTQYLQPYLDKIHQELADRNSFGDNGQYLKLTKYQNKSTAIGIALQLVSRFIDEI